MAPKTEKRADATDGVKYTRDQFVEYYGQRQGQSSWDKAGAAPAPKVKAKAKAKVKAKVTAKKEQESDEPRFGYSSEPSRLLKLEEHSFDYDLFVIGTGSGGMRATKFAKKMFKIPKVGTCDMPFSQLSVEGRSITLPNTVGGVGGTCVLRGCVPKKYFWYGSHFKHELEMAKGYGWNVDVKGHTWETLLKKKRAETERLHKAQAEKRLPAAGVELLVGRGKLLDKHTIQLGAPANKTVTAKTILLACGTTPSAIDIPGKEFCISSDHILELEKLPKRIAVIGAGYIACEFACMFAIWGTEVNVYYRKELPLRGFDEDCRRFLARQMDFDGVKLHPLHTPCRVEKQSDGKFTYVCTDSSGQEVKLTDCDEVLMATGRHANTWELGLENAGVEVNSGGAVKVDAYSKTTADSIYAIGDITDRMQLTPVAIQEAMAFLYTRYAGRKMKIDYSTVASAVFTQPPMGTCGLTEEAAVAKYPNLDIYMDGETGGLQAEVFNFTEAKEEMMVKIIVNADNDKVVAIHMVGRDAGEIMQGFGAAIKCGLRRRDLYDTVAIHPTSAEELVCIPGIDMMAPSRQYRRGKVVEQSTL